uniref:Uncharacterized protein n=2 Tax=Oryza sativa subsp. japonica TaxID=39947 RepID=Q2R7Y7_ORYSJ|nr:hypothetical protein LOC_Os11g14500 [Oryza sativa Japonica Group]ABA92382.1 hypothetical protein LOC_Os11g14500 [Oryza sativa Japonica Group]
MAGSAAVGSGGEGSGGQAQGIAQRNNLSTKKITEIAPAALMVGGKLTWQTVGRPRRLPPSAKIAIRPLPPVQRAARG